MDAEDDASPRRGGWTPPLTQRSRSRGASRHLISAEVAEVRDLVVKPGVS